MKCSDIPTDPILHFLAKHQGEWATRGPKFKGQIMPTVGEVIPADVPEKLVLAKMWKLIRKGLVSGCLGCTCRGDYEITDKGLARIGVRRTKARLG